MNIFELDQSLRKKQSVDPNGGISKEKETEFHADLDKLVHKTFGKRKDEDQGVAEVSRDTLKSYQQKVSADSMKHSADPTKRSQQKANRSVAGFAKAQNRLEQGVAEGAMPASVIQAKEKIRMASDEENKKRFKGKTKAELAQMARRHGYKDKNPYAKFYDGVTESIQSVTEFSPAGSGTPPRGPKTPGRDPWGDDDRGEDPYNRPKPRHYRRSSSYFEQFEADHFDKEDYDKATGVFKGYWENDDGSFTQIGYFKFDDPTQTGGDDPGMGWYYEPQNESVAEGAEEHDIVNSRLPIKHIERKLQEAGLEKDIRIFLQWAIDNGSAYIDDAIELGEKAKLNDPQLSIGLHRLKKLSGQGVAEGDNEKIAGRYDPEEFDDMVRRVGKLAKQGPLKTVWDPVKRVYKNVPVNKNKDVDEASLATMRDYFDGNLDAQDPTKISQMRKFFAKQHVPSKEIITKKFHKPDEYQQWISKVKPMATKNVREAGPYSRGYYNPMDDERREQEWSDRSTRDWKYRERASEEASVLYIFRPDLGKLRQRMWNHDQFREARAEGYKDSPDQAMKAFGYFPSKFKRGHYVKKGLDGKWESIFPYTDTNKPVGENTSTITLTMNDGSNRLLRSGTTALNAVKSVLSYLVRSKDFETLKNLKAVDGQDVTGIVSKIFKPSNTIDLGEALDTEFQSFLKQAKHRYPDSKDETEAFMRFVHDELEKEGRIDRSQASEIDDLEAKIDSLIIDLAKVSKAPPAVGL